ncbi:hypothetical protein LHP98_14410 [Rhodobacter sp. Har01]|uniref:hypothetical protein n=1 Tax=Rhodobacter sp. Har01 TaxID=2883999 RepID=UPI001D063757|nr:hypothetical protein [Rhodobacter sp. Har01]MCB6179314.1 hypothetical protein [Rhodobacter sp. Har01]
MTGPDRETLRRLVREAIAEALAELRPELRPGTAAATGAASDLRVVTEKTIAALPEGSTLRLAPEAVVTPLARDRARARRITLERTR